MKRRQMSSGDRDKILARVMGVTDDDASWRKHMAKSDVVIEAVFENLDLKHRVVRCTRVCGCVCAVQAWGCALTLRCVCMCACVCAAQIEEIEPLLRDDAVFATNTSALPIADIASTPAR